jgi:hypothetical protein
VKETNMKMEANLRPGKPGAAVRFDQKWSPEDKLSVTNNHRHADD